MMMLSRDMLPVLVSALYHSLHVLFMFGIFQAEDEDERIREADVHLASKSVPMCHQD